MKISNIFVGGWFQRTMLQLTEIYDFLRDTKTQLKLNMLSMLASSFGTGAPKLNK